ncbi:MAG: nucleotidyltransferase domain-containing protein [Thermoplasmata archaeon]|nr:nucleotidyltransferase domain-containing protein [Thermoplasmata archaeon]
MSAEKDYCPYLSDDQHEENDVRSGSQIGNGADWKLQEREKELKCIYSISAVLRNKDIIVEEAMKMIVDLIPPAWRYSEITCARILFDHQEVVTGNFRETTWKQAGEIRYGDEAKGSVEVYYLQEREDMGDGPFLPEERNLIETIGEMVGTYLEKRRIHQDLQKLERKPQVDKQDWEVILDLLMKTDPRGSLRITRRMIYHLYRIHNEEINNVINGICTLDENEDDSGWCGINIPNPREDIATLEEVQKKVFMIAKRSLSPQEIADLFNTWLMADKARSLLLLSQRRGVSLMDISRELNHFWDLDEDSRSLAPEDDVTIRTALIRHFFTGKLRYVNVAKKFMTLDNFVSLLKNVVGPPQGEGKLGGKVSGIFLAEKIIEKEKERFEELGDIKFPKSWYLTTDTMLSLIHYNDLDEISHIKYMDPNEIRQEQPFLEQIFKNSIFPPDILGGLRGILRDLGNRPIIVRSSSLLEDSFGAAFSGKYKSLFLVNEGSEEERLNGLLNAITEVYASTFAPEPIAYRKERGLLDFFEEMGILIQEVVGTRIGDYFIPAFAGVAFSNNEFRWSPRIRREDGIVRMVAGLGTRAVDRVGNDYPVLVSPNRPEIQVNTLVDEMVQYSQHYMDVINLKKGTLETVPSVEFLRENWDAYPMVNKIVSIHRDDMLTPVVDILHDAREEDMVITFSKLIGDNRFLPQIKRLLSILKEKMGTPVDVEFAHDGKALHILQCRPQSHATEMERVPIPKNIPQDRKLFSAGKYVTTSHIENIEYIVYVDPAAYGKLEERSEMYNVAQAVGALNRALPKRKFILMGPGRWGSRGDIKLGVPITYNDINNTALLIEIARVKGGYLPELSFGTHFFQDLVEADIHYLPLYPDEPENLFNEELLEIAPNHLKEMFPKYGELEGVVKVVEVSEISRGGTLSVVMDGEVNSALAYLMPPGHWLWRMKKVEEIVASLDVDLYGLRGIYVVGSTKEGTAGPESDIDIIVHQVEDEEKRDALFSRLIGWDEKICQENLDRTGVELEKILDVHIVTDDDIANKTSWATHIDSPYNPARMIPLSEQ